MCVWVFWKWFLHHRILTSQFFVSLLVSMRFLTLSLLLCVSHPIFLSLFTKTRTHAISPDKQAKMQRLTHTHTRANELSSVTVYEYNRLAIACIIWLSDRIHAKRIQCIYTEQHRSMRQQHMKSTRVRANEHEWITTNLLSSGSQTIATENAMRCVSANENRTNFRLERRNSQPAMGKCSKRSTANSGSILCSILASSSSGWHVYACGYL